MKVYLYTLLFLPLFSCGGMKANKNTNSGENSSNKPISNHRELPSGIILDFHKDVEGEPAEMGSVMYINLVNKVEDSVLFDSRQMIGEPAQIPLAPARYNGDLQEVFAMLSKGDSVTATIVADSFFRGNLPPFVKSGDKVYMTIDVEDIKTKADLDKERENYLSEQKAKDEENLTSFFKSNAINAQKSPSGYYYVLHKKGSGASPTKGQKVKVNYTGQSLEGDVFDSNVDPQFKHQEPFTFNVGLGQVIQGWDLALMDMKPGEKRTVYLPSYMAYGQNPPPGSPIKKDQCLVFDIELLGIEP